MKTKLFATVLVALMCATATWAQTPVSTDGELRAAIQNNNANIIVTADIDLSNSTLSIAAGTTVTINLGGHTLDRKLTRRGEGGGQVITVRSGATLNLSNGTLKGGWGGDAGGLSNESGTANLTNVTITGCTGDNRGGGICNFGTLTLNGCTITGNTTNTCGGGIWEEGTLYMSGTNTISGNTAAAGLTDNLFLKTSKVINITGHLGSSTIYVNMEKAGVCTNGFELYHGYLSNPASYFHADLADVMAITKDIGEAKLRSSLPAGSVYYYECGWDEANKTVTKQIKTLTREIDYSDVPSAGDYKMVENGNSWYQLGGYTDEIPEYYVVSGDVSNQTLNVLGKNVHLILCDNAKLTLSGGILCYGERKLYIHSQSYGLAMGKLKAQSGYEEGAAGIGSDEDYSNPHIPGDIEIHGGDIYAKGSEMAAGIGGGAYTDGGNLTIFGGKVEAHGGEETTMHYGGTGIGGGSVGYGGHIIIYDGEIYAYGGEGAAGIGTGYNRRVDHSYVEIYGGSIEARGGKNGAGIGGGISGKGIDLTIYDGKIYAYGGDDAAGIGGGWTAGGGTTTIHGGYVYAKGDGNGAGIGSGSEGAYLEGDINGGTITINGGEVYAYGGVDAAGIGGGEDGDGGTVTISGGYVYAEGNDYGAGIGGGQSGKGADVTITGGTVVAQSGRDQRAIGAGYGSDSHGSLTFADNMGVFTTTNLNRSVKANRVIDCRNFAYVRINQCAHGGATVSIVDGDKHGITCNWCYTTDEAHTFGSYGECTICHLISISDDAYNTTTLSHWAEENVLHAVTLSGRTLWKDGKWNTLCLPFSLASLTGTPFADATVKTLNTTAFADGTLTMNFSEDNLTSIEAGKPYIVKWAATTPNYVENPVFMNVTINNTTSNVATEYADFVGIYSPMAITGEDRTMLYLGDGDKLYYPNDAMTINACRAYFKLNGITAGDVNNAIMFFGDGETTEIISNTNRTNHTNSDAWYTLDGVKLNAKPTAKGVYINNGEKVVIK